MQINPGTRRAGSEDRQKTMRLLMCKGREILKMGAFSLKVLLGENIHTSHLRSPNPSLLALEKEVSTMLKGPEALKIQDPERSTPL